MGNESSSPVDQMPLDCDYFAVQIRQPDTLKVINAGKNVVDILRSCLTPYNILKKECYIVNNCYNFKMHGYPFVQGQSIFSGESNACKYLFCDILSALFTNGWETLISSDISQIFSNSTIFFRKKRKDTTETPYFSCIAPSWIDGLLIIRTAPDLAKKLVDFIHGRWQVQKYEQEQPDAHRIKLKGSPWGHISGDDATNIRIMLLELITIMRAHNYKFKININIKGTADCLYFQFDPSLSNSSPEDVFMMYLGRQDRLKLIKAPDYITDDTRNIIRTQWARGLQDEKTQYGSAYEFKLYGRPWLCDGEETVESRILIGSILQSYRARGWEVNCSMDMSRRLDDKSIFTFKQGPPINKPWLCISFHESDKVRISGNGPSVLHIIEGHLNSAGVVQRQRPYGRSMEFKIKGTPFFGTQYGSNESQDIAITMLIRILKDLNGLGWRLDASADISAKYFKRGDNYYPLDTHSWFFTFNDQPV